MLRILATVLIVIGLNSACSTKPKITSINVSYIKGQIHPIVSISCGEARFYMKSQFNVDTVLKDVSVLNKIEASVNLLDLKDTLNQLEDCDIRIQCILNYSNKTSRRLCIGDFNCFVFDGIHVGECDSLAYLIKSHIGYYNFFDKESRL